MERRQAIAVSAMGALVLASGVVTIKVLSGHGRARQSAAGTVSPTSATTAAPAPGGPSPTLVVTKYEDVIDRYVVPTPLAAAPPAPAAGAPSPPVAGDDGDDTVQRSPEPFPTTTTTPPVAETPTITGTSGPTTTTGPAPLATPTTTTGPATTTTTRPPGVPSDWPAGKPIPPVPPGCRDPQLEDNGQWNCQH